MVVRGGRRLGVVGRRQGRGREGATLYEETGPCFKTKKNFRLRMKTTMICKSLDSP